MDDGYEAEIILVDPLNPSIGYQVKVSAQGRELLSTTVDPRTTPPGDNIPTFDDAVRVLTYYIAVARNSPRD